MVRKQKTLTYAAVAAILTLLATAATAGVTGTEFLPIFTLLSDWVSGYLGRTIAFTGMILGVGAAALSQRPVLGLIGLFFGVLVLVMPNVLNAMLTAVI
ncbi:MAG TPA: TraA family conjugative transfer protein [Burkholderiales bacterium]|nr:TraA family conjugative transfer protein [Burkholderiales bacterium]